MGKSQLDLSTLEDESYALTNLINAEMNNGVRLTNPDPVEPKNTDTNTVKITDGISIELVNDNENNHDDQDEYHGDHDDQDEYHGHQEEYHDDQDEYHDEYHGNQDEYHDDHDEYHDDHDEYHGDQDEYHGDQDEYHNEYHDEYHGDQENVPLSVLHAQQKTQKRTLVVKIKELQQRLYDIETCPKTFTVSDSLEELEYEYERLVELRNARSTRAWYRKLLLGLTNGIEWMNHKWNPVGLKLDGWSTDLAATIDEFDDIFDELAEKYGGNIQSRISPELRLVALVLYSGMAYSVGQTLASKATPEIAEIINKDPVLRERFVKAATDIQMEKMTAATNNTTTAPFFGKVKSTINDIFSTKQGNTTINDFMNDLDNSDIKVNELGL